MKSKEQDAENWNIGFWFIWIILIGFIDYGYVYLDNEYLED